MCDPLTIGIGALTVGGMVAGHISEEKAAEANAQMARQNLAQSYKDINTSYREQATLASQKGMQLAAEGADIASEITLSSAEGNVAGASVTALLNDVSRQESSAREVIKTNLLMLARQADNRKAAARQTARARVLGVPGPSLASTGLQIGGSVLGSIDIGIQRKKNRA